MPRRKSLSKALLFTSLAAVLVAAGSATDPEVTIDPGDKTLWKKSTDQVLNAQVSCYAGGNGSQIEHVHVEGPRFYGPGFGAETSGLGKNHSYSLDMSPEKTGEYYLEAKCKDGGYTRKSFWVDRMELNVISPVDGEKAYLGQSLPVELSIGSAEGRFKVRKLAGRKSEWKFTAQIGNGKVLRHSAVDYTGENTKVRLKMDTDLISSDSRRVDINFSVPYMESQGRGFWLSDEVQNLELNRWKIEDLKVRPGEVLSAQSVSELSITADILYEGEPVNQREDLSSGDFYIRRPGQDGYQSFSAELVKPEEGRYRLDLNGRIPNLDGVGSHRLEVVFRSNLSSSGPVKVTDLRVEKKFEFTGKVSNSNRRVVDTSFTLTPENGDYTHRFSTDASGEFSRRILPGKWDFSVDFPKAELNLENVKLDPSYIGNDPDERPNINYDYFKQPGSMDMELEGVKPINMLAISFGYPFKSASVKMDYNPAKAEDPMEVQVFECTNWNFWARSCIGNWEKIPEEEIMRKPTEWWAKFPVDPVQTSEFGGTENVMLNAYVIGTNSDLVVNQLQWNDARVPVGEDFTVEGIVQSGSGAAVQGANVTFSLMKNGGVVKSKTVQSGSDGRFSLTIQAPEKGSYRMKIQATKEPFNSYTKNQFETRLETYLKTGIKAEVQEIVLVPGEETTSDITIRNTGQKTLENVQLEVEGPQWDGYSLSRTDLGTIPPGGSKSLELSTTLPASYCNSGCGVLPTFDLVVKAQAGDEEITKRAPMVSRIEQDGTSSRQNTGQQNTGSATESPGNQSSSGSLLGNNTVTRMTGQATDFLKSQSSLQLALGLIMLFTIVLAGAIKKKKNDSRGPRDSRRGRMRSMKGNGSGVAAKPPQVEHDHGKEDEDEAGEDVREEGEEDLQDDEELGDEEGPGEDEEESIEVDDIDEDGEEDQQQEPEKDSGDEEVYECGVCGEEFDTESGRKLHRQALHD